MITNIENIFFFIFCFNIPTVWTDPSLYRGHTHLMHMLIEKGADMDKADNVRINDKNLKHV